MTSGPIGILGGTFDPIHFGHLRTGLEVMTATGLAELRFIPCREPPHRPPPRAPGALRLAMVRAAIEGQPGFLADDRELRRPGPSYMVDTLAELRAEFPARPLVLVLGTDAFLGLPRWHRWLEIAGFAHIVVMGRPGFEAAADDALRSFLAGRVSTSPADLAASPAGRVFHQEVTRLEISSSAIRRLLAEGGDPRYLVPEAVLALLRHQDCYRP
jgi:nicotinate-nucleotide adenylyltransferase